MMIELYGKKVKGDGRGLFEAYMSAQDGETDSKLLVNSNGCCDELQSTQVSPNQ